jgi:hypothetical protein
LRPVGGLILLLPPGLRVLMHNPKMESDIREQRAAAKRRIDAAERGPEPTLRAMFKKPEKQN